MCGIAGVMRFDGQPIEHAMLMSMLDKLEHRGQDSTNIEMMGQIALGHRRLSIIDLNESAAQPMFYADKSLCVTLNGEIYNYLELRNYLVSKDYEFVTKSDTEVLLAAYYHWGTACVDHLNGMFAFAIWDKRSNQLFCARDHVGIKPFYYRRTPHYFAFASEAFAIAHLEELHLNYNAVLSYLMSMYVATNESIFASVHKLPPGHTLTLDSKGKMRIERFWAIEAQADAIADSTNLEFVDHTIKQAIRQQIRSDVPIGGFLSGGVDSGLITALAAPHVKHYYTYSVGYEGMVDNELPFAHALAKRYDTKHTQVTITAHDAMSNLNQALRNMSEPIADPAMVATYLLSNLAKHDGVKVLLNGTGGDEVFAGYTRYTGQLSLKRRLLLQMPYILKRALSTLPIASKFKARLKHSTLDMLFSTGGSYQLAYKISHNRKYLLSFLQQLTNEFHLPVLHDLALLYQHMFFDLHVYLPDELLFLLDQMTMAHTIEGRVPLLDVNIIKAAFKFKADEHVNGGQTKAILKQIALPYLGKEHIYRKKQGFAGSPIWWVNQNLPEFLSVIADLKQISYFDKLDIDKYYKPKQMNDLLANEMFILYCFGKWHERLRT